MNNIILTLITSDILTTVAAYMSVSNLIDALLIILILALFYVIRKFELNRRALKLKAERNEFLSGVLNNAPLAILITDNEGKVTDANEVFGKVFGYTKEEIAGQKVDDFLRKDTLPGESSNNIYSENEEHKKIYQICRRLTKDDEPVDVELHTSPNYIGEDQLGYILFYNDISKRLKAESALEITTRNYHNILDTLEDAYFEAGSDGVLTYVSKKFVEATKYNSKEELIGKHFRHLVARNSVAVFFKEFKKIYQTNKPVEPFDLKYITKDGQEFSSEIVVSPILEDGKAVGTRGLIRDISERVKASEILKQAKEAAEQHASELASINRVAEKVSSSLGLEEILSSVCKELAAIFPVRNAGVSLISSDRKMLEVLAFHSINPNDEIHTGKYLNLEGNVEAKRLLESKQSIVVRKAKSDPRTKPVHDLIKGPGKSSIIIVPLVSRGESIGVIGMTAKDPDYDFKNTEIELAETIASQIASSVENARLHAKTEQALDVAERDLEIGRQIQSGFFPKDLPEIPGWEISAFFKAARQVSGDFYDAFEIGDRGFYAVVVADVCDKGVGAALFMVLLRSLIRSFSEQNRDETDVEKLLDYIATNVNNYICNTHGQSNMFATLMLGILDASNNNLYYVNGGHDAPLLVDENGNCKTNLEPTGPAFGFTTELTLEIGKVEFVPGDMLIVFTDGLTEAKNSSGEFYSEERLKTQLMKRWCSAFSAVKFLEIDAISHIGNYSQFDDITLVALRRNSVNQTFCHSMSLKAEMDNLPSFRNFVVEACRQFKVNEDITETLKLAGDEISSNIIIHGYKGRQPGDINIQMSIHQNELNIKISDTGNTFDPETLAPPDLEAEIDDRQIGGLGVFFVKEMVDELSYSSVNGVNTTCLKMKL